MKNLYLLIFIGICLLVTSPVKAQLQDQRNNLSIGVNGGGLTSVQSVSLQASKKANLSVLNSV